MFTRANYNFFFLFENKIFPKSLVLDPTGVRKSYEKIRLRRYQRISYSAFELLRNCSTLSIIISDTLITLSTCQLRFFLVRSEVLRIHTMIYGNVQNNERKKKIITIMITVITKTTTTRSRHRRKHRRVRDQEGNLI